MRKKCRNLFYTWSEKWRKISQIYTANVSGYVGLRGPSMTFIDEIEDVLKKKKEIAETSSASEHLRKRMRIKIIMKVEEVVRFVKIKVIGFLLYCIVCYIVNKYEKFNGLYQLNW